MPGAGQGRRVCLAIGVANAESLASLPGAANAARDIGDWARCSGFDSVTVLTDEPLIGQTRWSSGDPEPQPINHASGLPVSIARLKEEIGLLLPAGELTEWFVLHFAGHGLRQDLTRTLWLPSDWKSSGKAVAVEPLKARLETYGIQNLTIISDACRDYATSPATADSNPDAIIDPGPIQQVSPALDRFNAVADGKPAFMVPGATATEARCILSGTIANAVWGHEDAAFPKHAPDKVLSNSLLQFIGPATKAVGERYGLESQAEPIRGFGNGNPEMVYYDRGRPPQPQAPIVAWPSPTPPTAPSAEIPNAAVEAATARIRRIPIPGTFAGFAKGGAIPDSVFDLAFAINREREPGLSEERQRLRTWRTEVAEEAVKQVLEKQVQKGDRKAIRIALREGQGRSSSQNNLILRGKWPVRIWAPAGVQRVDRKKSWWVSVGGRAAVQIIVEYDDGLFLPLVVYDGMDTVAAYDGEGRVAGWMCLPEDAEGTANLTATTDAISRLQTGKMSAADADALATQIRFQKHLNPMLGAIAAYLYDYIGDRDNIRRMAWYYAQSGQPIPYDIVLLGLMETYFDGSQNALVARIPAVPARQAANNGRQQPEFATCKTTAREGRVAGQCPWLRQGWDYVAAPEDAEKAMTAGLQPAVRHVVDSSFTALSSEGAQYLINAWQLEADR